VKMVCSSIKTEIRKKSLPSLPVLRVDAGTSSEEHGYDSGFAFECSPFKGSGPLRPDIDASIEDDGAAQEYCIELIISLRAFASSLSLLFRGLKSCVPPKLPLGAASGKSSLSLHAVAKACAHTPTANARGSPSN
jgi:hypothetical protein